MLYRQSLPQFSSVTSSSTSPQMLTEEKIRATTTARQNRRAKLAMHFCWLWEIRHDRIPVDQMEERRKSRSMLGGQGGRQPHGPQVRPRSRAPGRLAPRDLIHRLSPAISNIGKHWLMLSATSCFSSGSQLL